MASQNTGSRSEFISENFLDKVVFWLFLPFGVLGLIVLPVAAYGLNLKGVLACLVTLAFGLWLFVRMRNRQIIRIASDYVEIDGVARLSFSDIEKLDPDPFNNANNEVDIFLLDTAEPPPIVPGLLYVEGAKVRLDLHKFGDAQRSDIIAALRAGHGREALPPND